MKIAIEGCAHGDLDMIYETISYVESQEKIKVDLLICCGDFQATRNQQDLSTMAVPPKYRDMCSFHKYYSGEKQAPVLTIFIGGNHEASNHLQELPYGGWAAPNIYYLGYAGVVTIGGVRIAGLSGIYKGRDYMTGHHEKPPYNENTKRSVYHIRSLEVFRLKQLTGSLNIVLSHDWPRGITDHGDTDKLLRRKGFFAEDIRNNRLGSEPAMDLLNHLRPAYWFSAHLHCKYPAIVKHGPRQGVTKFLALDKCLPKRKFLQIIDVADERGEAEANTELELCYDLEWLAVLRLTNHLLSVKRNIVYMPGKSELERWKFTPTQEEKEDVLQRFGGDLKIPLNFTRSAPVHDPNSALKGHAQACLNPQTTEFCKQLGVDDPVALLMSGCGKGTSDDTNESRVSLDSSCLNEPPSDYSQLSVDASPLLDSSTESGSSAVPLKRLSMSLPPPRQVEDSDFLSLSFTSQDSLQITQEVSQTSGTEDSLSGKKSLDFLSLSFNSQESLQMTQEMPQPSPTEKKKSLDESADSSELDNSSGSTRKKFKRRNQALYTSTEDDD